jgi:predicted nucleic acid-binding protein
MMAGRFLDTNVLLRYLTRDDEEKARLALALLTRVERGEEKVVTSPLVIFETVFTLQKRYGFPKEQIRDAVSDIISLRGLELSNKSLYIKALELFVSGKIPFTDAHAVAYMQSQGLDEIYSWDTDFDHIAGLRRVEPKEAAG